MSKREVGEGGRKVVYELIESFGESKLGDVRREEIDCFVEVATKSEFGERRGEAFHWLIIIVSKS